LLHDFMNQVLRRIEVLQFVDSKKGTKDALLNINKFNLGPRDAFHLSLMQNNSIDKIVTSDNDFIKIASAAGILSVE